MKNLPDSKWAADWRRIVAAREAEYFPPTGIFLICWRMISFNGLGASWALESLGKIAAAMKIRTRMQRTGRSIGRKSVRARRRPGRRDFYGTQDRRKSMIWNHGSRRNLQAMQRIKDQS